MPVEISQIEESANQLQSLMERIPAQRERLNQELTLCDREVSDILHMIELSNFHASEGYKLSKDIQITLKKRREIKNELDSLIKIAERMRKNRPLIHQTQLIGKTVKSREESLIKRMYTPKVRTDMTDKFRELEEKQRRGVVL